MFRPNLDNGTIGQNDFEFLDVIRRRSIIGGVGSARIIRNHSAEGRTRARRDIRAKAESVRTKKLIELIQDDTRSNSNRPAFEIEIGDQPQMAREIDHDAFTNGTADEPGA